MKYVELFILHVIQIKSKVLSVSNTTAETYNHT